MWNLSAWFNKITLLIILFFSILTFAQVGYIPVDDEIYLFLERMQTLDIIDNYNSFELPKTRKEIAGYLSKIILRINDLDKIDQLKLNDFISEFEYDLFKTKNNISTLIPNYRFNYLTTEKEKYLFAYTNSTNTNLFVNALGILNYLNENQNQTVRGAFLYRFGGEIRGSLFDRLGFYAKVTNGSYSGNKDLAKSFGSLSYNYKLNNETGSKIGDNFFDETESFLTLDYDYARIKIGNDRKFIGYGSHKILLSDNAPRMEYLEFNLKYKAISFSSFHGKLLGARLHRFEDPIKNYTEIFDKYLAYHRLQINPNKHFNFGVGEIIVYANRNMDFSYLNPFNFYKSSEHLNQDRDNSMLFFDFYNKSIKGLKLFTTILLDDIDFGKIGTGWYGNKTLMNFGLYSNLLYKYLPVDFELQYIRIEPYVFSHRLPQNNFTNFNFNIGSTLQPNTGAAIIKLYYRPYYRINMSLSFMYAEHGANIYDNNKNLEVNYGGNILEGHRVSDSEKVYFLDGKREVFRKISLTTTYEPKKNIILSLYANYSNNLLATSQFQEKVFINFALNIKF